MSEIVDIKVGHEVPKERWLEAAENLKVVFQVVANQLKEQNGDGRGEQDCNESLADAVLAIVAMEYVANCATDKCRFMPIMKNNGGKQNDGK